MPILYQSLFAFFHRETLEEMEKRALGLPQRPCRRIGSQDVLPFQTYKRLKA
jgi:hypothetical protein